MTSFQTTTYGKWILSGEHSVLRGQEALVFPLFSRGSHFSFTPVLSQKNQFSVKITGSNAIDIESIVRALVAKAFDILEREQPGDLKGEIKIDNHIPLGSGLGASSSLCVAFGRWFEHMGYIQKEMVYEFSRKLENLFHGESSGIDIAVVLNEKPLIFKRPSSMIVCENYFKPTLYLSYSGQRGVTKDCVEKVKALFESDRDKALELDQQMMQATDILKKAFLLQSSQGQDLSLTDKQNRLDQISIGFDKAYSVFKQWGLTLGAVDNHIEKLNSLGAVACKPTGSGGGGYVLSLWPQDFEPKAKDIEFIKAF